MIVIGPSFDDVFVASNEKRLVIPQLLTRLGLTDYFVRQKDELTKLTEMDSWVLNITKPNPDTAGGAGASAAHDQYSAKDQERILNDT
ncbi:ImcF-related family protein [Xenorhabdus doucetiae]|uniref:IcmF-related domain-containing protein n=1 Tax=Xenorhabdus doucetiae TaxID=351671 RepID=A0A068QZZ4_9GAMM|nr:ImcF-related family protein [Xenorhabdus doucetiae]CDG19400.1 protein of unknown function [Xenorhabdus doucetiae]